MGDNPSEFAGCSKCPVERVSWYEVNQFINKLNKNQSRKYRLPTEAEWEYVCRAGKNTAFAYGNSLYDSQAIISNNYSRPQIVASLTPNAWGVYDMHGNVNEWCTDWYGNYSKRSATDPVGHSSSTNRKITRGGGWNDQAKYCRCGNRSRVKPDLGDANNNIGFRLVMTSE